MLPTFRSVAILAAAIFAIAGCSHGSSDPIQPNNTGEQFIPGLTAGSGRTLLGVWTIHINPYSSKAIVTLNRTIQAHQNMLDPNGSPIPEPDVDYEPVDGNQASPDYNPNFADFREWVIWRLQIGLTNDTEDDFYDVRGIIITGDTLLGVHNADGLTTVWDDTTKGDDENPFKYYGLISPSPLVEPIYTGQTYDVEFVPPNEPDIDCEECTQPPPDAVDPDQIMLHPDDVYINFAVDASIDEPCEEPYAIEYEQHFIQTSPEPGDGFARITVDVFDHDPESIEEVKIESPDFGTIQLQGENGHWYTQIYDLDIGHEAIYFARISAKSSGIDNVDPLTNPDTLYKDIRIIMGNMNGLLNALFALPDTLPGETLITDVKVEWDAREADIYSAGYLIEDSYSYGMFEPINYFVLISYNVGSSLNYGAVRIPSINTNYVPDTGWPIMVFCHAGRWVCDWGAPTGVGSPYEYYDSHKDSFVEVIPAYRGNGLCWNDVLIQEYDDEINSPADFDVDDVLSFLHIVRENVNAIEDEVGWDSGINGPLIDISRVGIMGGSRGGSPTYLAKLRDSYYEEDQIDLGIVVFGSVTDWFSSDIKTACEYYIENDGYVHELVFHYYNEDYNFFKHILEPYLDPSSTMTLEEARYKILISSPLWFADDYLQTIQVNHGVLDPIVRIGQSLALDSIIGEEPNEFHYYLLSGHVPGMLEEDQYNVDYDDVIDSWLGDI